MKRFVGKENVTYISKEQEEKIAVFFEKAITKYGAENFVELMDLRKRFNDTMEEVLDESE